MGQEALLRFPLDANPDDPPTEPQTLSLATRGSHRRPQPCRHAIHARTHTHLPRTTNNTACEPHSTNKQTTPTHSCCTQGSSTTCSCVPAGSPPAWVIVCCSFSEAPTHAFLLLAPRARTPQRRHTTPTRRRVQAGRPHGSHLSAWQQQRRGGCCGAAPAASSAAPACARAAVQPDWHHGVWCAGHGRTVAVITTPPPSCHYAGAAAAQCRSDWLLCVFGGAPPPAPCARHPGRAAVCSSP